MTKKLLMGNEAIALGAIRAGVSVVTGYPGTPSTEILETIVKEKPSGVHTQWSVNEKTALEVAAGAAIAGCRTLTTMKQVGLNVASDPLMSLNYVGVKGGMVIAVADDPGPVSSQTEQDTRHFAKFAKLALFDPATPEEAYHMVADAFDLSERLGRPVLFRPTTRVCHSYASVRLLENLPRREPEGFSKDNGRWAIFPKLTYENHWKIEEQLIGLSKELSQYEGNRLSGAGKKGIAAGGVSVCYAQEALARIENASTTYKFLKIGAYPFPAELALKFLHGLDEVLVIEELDPVIETELLTLCGAYHLPVRVKGKRSGELPVAGEYSPQIVHTALSLFLQGQTSPQKTPAVSLPPLPVRPPVLCAGCPHRASFFAVKEAAKGRKAVFSGDIGCYTLGNAKPLSMVDTCLCMGAGISMAQGLHHAEPDALHFAFIGDSTFFHTGIPGLINAVTNAADIIVAILDNSTTAMTGGQPHPGMGRTAANEPAPIIDIYALVAALGISIEQVNAFDLEQAKDAVTRAIEKKGVRVILFTGACINEAVPKKPLTVNHSLCTGCKACVSRLGCPAISFIDKKSNIDNALCTGCGLCARVCAFGAIRAFDAIERGDDL